MQTNDYTNMFYVNGRWIRSHGTRQVVVTNPATEESLGRVTLGDVTDVEAVVDAARRAAPGWAGTPVSERAALLRAVAAELALRQEEIARLETAEVGSPITLSRRAHAQSPIHLFASAADLVERSEPDETIPGATVLREPYGVVGAITPWNYPLHQSAAKIAPALAAGNTVVHKPSETTPLGAYALAEAIESAGLPPGVFNMVMGDGATVGARVAGHPDVDLVSFTGSTRAGVRVAAEAAATVKKVSLELGGKSPAVILPGAPLRPAVRRALRSGFLNSGQTCMALTRILVDRARLAEAEEIVRDAVADYVVGDPTDPDTEYGPLVSKAQRDRVRDYVRRGQREGLRLITGGPDRPAALSRGYYLPLTVFSDVPPTSALVTDEIFGPVLVIQVYDSVGEAVDLANRTPYGLCAGVWGADRAEAVEVAGRLQVGQVFVNGAGFNPDVPFGGFKRSGIGREYGRYGLEEFQQTKGLVFGADAVGCGGYR
ncbi:aldehyde dehydrogenase family protein [Nocardiopsis dassonvillei]|uniref:aldehyde dehydrogenase (NAD(+)) n=1 Tax=Nocardiopsis dassonvillei (strain ATCC 23218 / DSM 43111 / CIP 107115 / JCM 7437 / KCTC 9190 / NBRC 14626 / NCTC 10488 / NRRL B-5397 / IMRU 509) TaxID=446468 RepID=D7B2S1_NOCDD|nr:aldehyde dehydrogenase family protein [Nocardiopsis dassonvillei]ADH66769.1 Aldehyde dehydrogenase (NAD(+)) [Nocardiopsis dassonvillei subsp. dassonvillei DSM 43111]MCP3017229.1 aldehyde dehydrogenase family protein [Nocardiopsis dassonvillei]NKY78594.1 aldehyde dehydrogenase family protein [Nocardiopsis dassonvillei]VEI86395.1 Putative aldehyde dehydrogenase SA1924 [Nocardiopsis dassonvillei]